jgi:hypothetical protein
VCVVCVKLLHFTSSLSPLVVVWLVKKTFGENANNTDIKLIWLAQAHIITVTLLVSFSPLIESKQKQGRKDNFLNWIITKPHTHLPNKPSPSSLILYDHLLIDKKE